MNHSPIRTLGRQLAMTAKATRAELDARLAEAGGSLSMYLVLRHAAEAAAAPHLGPGAELSQRELAGHMGIEGPTMVRHLDRLEGEGLIERRRDPRDRRVTRITVTPDGARVLADLEAVAAAMDTEIGALLGEDEYRAAFATLTRLQSHMLALAAERKAHAHATL